MQVHSIESWIEQILAAPTDEMPRFLFADWLEDQGDPRATNWRRLVNTAWALELAKNRGQIGWRSFMSPEEESGAERNILISWRHEVSSQVDGRGGLHLATAVVVGFIRTAVVWVGHVPFAAPSYRQEKLTAASWLHDIIRPRGLEIYGMLAFWELSQAGFYMAPYQDRYELPWTRGIADPRQADLEGIRLESLVDPLVHWLSEIAMTVMQGSDLLALFHGLTLDCWGRAVFPPRHLGDDVSSWYRGIALHDVLDAARKEMKF